MQHVIGLDLSLTAPGWFLRQLGPATFGPASDPETSHGVWSPPGRGLERMHWICKKVLGLLPTWGETLVVIEGFSFGSKGAALYEIGGLGYIVRYALWFKNVTLIEVAPSQVKKFATGKGNVNKNIVIREVFKRWAVDATDDNEADAYVLGRIGMCLAGIDEPQTAFQRAVIDDLRKKAKAA